MAQKKETVGGGSKLDKMTLSHVMRHMILNPESKVTFYAKLLQKMARVETDKVTLAAVGVEKTGITLYFNPLNLGGLSYDQLVYVLQHEIMHVIFRHQARSGGTVTERDNVAADLAVNSLLGEIDFNMTLADGRKIEGLLYPGKGQFSYLPVGKSYEWYYRNLKEDIGQGRGGECTGKKGKDGGQGGNGQCSGCGKCGKNGSGSGSGGSGKGQGQGQGKGVKGHDGHDGHNIRKGSPETTVGEAHWNKAVREAYSDAKRMGNLPGELESAIEDMLKPRINWRVQLRKFVGHHTQMGTKPSLKRLNRRVPLFGVVPGQVNKYTSKMLYAIDTSGSMGDREVNAAVREMKALPIPYTMVECDTRIAGVTHMSKWKRFSGKVRGGGGTDFTPVFDYAKKHGFNGIIFVTDLCGNFPTDNKIRTLWLSTMKGQKAPFGETVEIDLE